MVQKRKTIEVIPVYQDFTSFNWSVAVPNPRSFDQEPKSYELLSDTHGMICGCTGCSGNVWLLPLLESGENVDGGGLLLGDDALFPLDEPRFNGDGSSVSFSVQATGDQGIDGLISTLKWNETTISYSNPVSPSDYQSGYFSDANGNGISAINEDFSQFNSNQLDAIHYALNEGESGGLNVASNAMAVEAFTNLNIDYVGANGNGTIRVANSSDVGTAYAYFPSTTFYGGDAFFGASTIVAVLQAGNYEFLAALHEIGHSLGLKHGHEANTYGAMPAALDSMEYSVMTYRSYAGAPLTGYVNEQWGFAQSWMMYDIAALQHMYGADFTVNSGDTVYSWSPTSGNTLINGQVAINPGGNRIFATIWDGGGNDTYDLSAYSDDLVLDVPSRMITLILADWRFLWHARC